MGISSTRRALLVLAATATLAAGTAVATATAASASADSTHTPTVASRTSSATPLVIRPQAAPTFAQTLCWGGVTDGAILTWDTSLATTNAQPIVATAVESTSAGSEFYGDAEIVVAGVAVHPGQIQVKISTGFGSPLIICVHFVG
jgi:hypothetical protein